MNSPIAIELAPFTLASGLSEAALLAASDRLEQEFLARAEGYLGRMLVRKDGRNWLDIVFWQSSAHAAKAMEQAAASEVCGAYFQCMAAADHDDPSQGVTMFETVKRYGAVPA